MNALVDLVLEPLGRVGAAAQNALEIARFGGLETGEQATPFDVVATTPMMRLRRYGDGGPAVLLVPPMMLAADVYDVSPACSAVSILLAEGVDPWVVDFGAPEREAGGLERTLTDHVVAVSDAVDRVRAAGGRDVHLAGYSQGGMFCYQAAAYRRGAGLASVIAFGSPVDLGALPFGIPAEIAVRAAGLLRSEVFAGQSVPAWMARTSFRLADPVKAVRRQLEFLLALHDREALLARESQRRFIERHGWVAWPGPALADFAQQFVANNRMLSGGFVIDGRLVTLADVAVPVLTVAGEVDEIAPLRGVRAIERAAPAAAVHELLLGSGHFGLVVGRAAARVTWPAVAGWARWRDDGGALPDAIRRVGADEPHAATPVGTRVGVSVDLVSGVGRSLARALVGGAARAARTAQQLADEAARQLPRLTRLERIEPATRISVGLLLDEQARRAPDHVAFLFADRAHTRAAAKQRIDRAAGALLALGLRRGEHVGVLMPSPPGALVALAALNRIGSVAVLLRSGGHVARELELGGCARVIADREHAAAARAAGASWVAVLDGDGHELPAGTVDVARVAADACAAPNPGRAAEPAFVLFSGAGRALRARPITNGGWATAAFATASAAALTDADTVLSVTPVQHPVGLLIGAGGAVAGGARLALASGLDPDAYWQQVRRYGATVATYSATQLRELVERPPHPHERHHPLRLLVGAGMPRGLWRRVEQRVAPARVLELHVAAGGDALLANVTGAKPGCKGRPVPGGAELALARIDGAGAGLLRDDDGRALRCAPGETGLLLVRERFVPATAAGGVLRSVFAPDDAWVHTGELLHADGDGDHWLDGSIATLIATAGGAVAPLPIADALGDLDAVDLAVAYGVGRGTQVVVAAITQRPRTTLAPADLAAALRALPAGARPAIVHVVRTMPLTPSLRPDAAALRRRGLPRPSSRAWARDGERYVALTKDARSAL